MSPEKASVTVRIAGEEHTIRANAEPEYTKRCAKMVDDRIHGIRVQAGARRRTQGGDPGSAVDRG